MYFNLYFFFFFFLQIGKQNILAGRQQLFPELKLFWISSCKLSCFVSAILKYSNPVAFSIIIIIIIVVIIIIIIIIIVV